jgi:hypothetical protein
MLISHGAFQSGTAVILTAPFMPVLPDITSGSPGDVALLGVVQQDRKQHSFNGSRDPARTPPRTKATRDSRAKD